MSETDEVLLHRQQQQQFGGKIGLEFAGSVEVFVGALIVHPLDTLFCLLYTHLAKMKLSFLLHAYMHLA